MSQKGKTKWVEKITQEDINSLPLILLGLNYQKFFPHVVPNEVFNKTFQKLNSDMDLFTSQFTNKTLTSGIKKADSHSDLVNVFHYKYEYAEVAQDYQDFSHPPIKVNFSPSDSSEVEVDSRLQGIDKTIINEIEQ